MFKNVMRVVSIFCSSEINLSRFKFLAIFNFVLLKCDLQTVKCSDSKYIVQLVLTNV